ncbi:MAG: DUF3524 domain-containing protein [Candidatus Promineifilaceae bacterium]
MRVLLISPYHGGSHQAWAEGYQRYSQHEVRLLTLPARFWKWRMHGGAVTLAQQFLADNWQPDLFLATDMLDLTTFLALTRERSSNVPAVLYYHENQLTYPTPQDKSNGPWRRQAGERDQHYAFVNYVSALAADCILFNSRYHQDAFLAALPNFLKHFPDYNALETIEVIAGKSQALPVGIEFSRFAPPARQEAVSEPPLILWNQRWEYDKNPGDFFAALYAIADAGIPFRLALCGENFRRHPLEFEEALTRLAPFIVHAGYANKETYRQLLWQAAITISTAHHEFFGISILEAIYCHTFPLLPRRLSYPELLPAAAHESCLYDSQAELVAKLAQALTHTEPTYQTAISLTMYVRQYDWQHLAPVYDQILASLKR